MKHIYALAKEIYESNPTNNPPLASLQDHFMEVRKALLQGRLYIGVRSVAKSGMSRTLAIAFVDKYGDLYEVWPAVYRMAGCDKNNRIRGGNTNMLFAAQYNLFQELCPKMKYQDKMPRYKLLP